MKNYNVLNRKKSHCSDIAEMFSAKKKRSYSFFHVITAVIDLKGGSGKQGGRKGLVFQCVCFEIRNIKSQNKRKYVSYNV